MNINISRLYKQEKITMDCQVITPMFLGNADQDAQLRASPFKGLLRYWWRVAHGTRYDSPQALLAAENDLFGSAGSDDDKKNCGKSRIGVSVTPVSGMETTTKPFSSPGNVDHPECENTHHRVNPLNYLAGMGLIHFKKGIQHSYFPSGATFTWTLNVPHDRRDELETVLKLIQLFGAIGSRCRNGWGCFSWPGTRPGSLAVQKWENAFSRDYPHCLGRDDRGDLFWRTRRSASSWEECMRELARVYISIRAGNREQDIPGLDVTSGQRPDRHLLGYPITNHNLKIWNNGRHGSALRLLVRREGADYRGFFLHLPHLYSKKMWPADKERQIRIWQQVHTGLDKLCQRIPYQEG